MASSSSTARSQASRTGRSPHIGVFPDAAAVARALAARVASAIAATPRLVLGLPTGRTPLLFYEELSRLHLDGHVDFSHVRTFNLDEFLGIPQSHPGSYRSFMERHLFGRVNIDPRNVHFLQGAAADPDEECERYEDAIAEAGGLDLQILGIGTNGHIGFNEPAATLNACTHVVELKRRAPRKLHVSSGRSGARSRRCCPPHSSNSTGTWMSCWMMRRRRP
jgi:glucosamine-6-phosphate deaminase